ncbi:hypothetical protein F5Y04DRAFT_121272 [Hypomontagnella monticulosa]|nr:hypothetical protein F5Y04DRAFT_121272 [Hypomontagnella monticulosa]
MPSVDLEYPKQPYSKVNRYDHRASYALETIHTIINNCPILHVSFTPPNSPFPTILPMIGQMGSFDRPSADTGDVLELYLHGYVSSRIINLSRNANGNNSEPSGEEGLPVCVAASQIDGLVLSLTPNSHSYNYRSAVVFGYATLVTDLAEKLYAMELITNSVVRDRYRHTRVPPNGAELQSTGILRVKISAGSAKLGSGVPKDEKADMEDKELVDRVWTGVVPMHYTFDEPVPGPYNKVQQTPAYLQEYMTDFNRDSKDYAVEAATKSRDVPKPKHDD